jgi:hypothetical protein
MIVQVRFTSSPVGPKKLLAAVRLRARATADSLHGYTSEGWAHFAFTRINITPTILPQKIEDLREAGATLLNAALLGQDLLD